MTLSRSVLSPNLGCISEKNMRILESDILRPSLSTLSILDGYRYSSEPGLRHWRIECLPTSCIVFSTLETSINTFGAGYDYHVALEESV